MALKLARREPERIQKCQKVKFQALHSLPWFHFSSWNLEELLCSSKKSDYFNPSDTHLVFISVLTTWNRSVTSRHFASWKVNFRFQPPWTKTALISVQVDIRGQPRGFQALLFHSEMPTVIVGKINCLSSACCLMKRRVSKFQTGHFS